MSKRYNIFISHSWNYPNGYDSVVGMLDKCGFEYQNFSVPKDDPIQDANNDDELYEGW